MRSVGRNDEIKVGHHEKSLPAIVNGVVYPTLISPRKIALKHKPAAPCNDHGVNFVLGPLLKELVKFGESSGFETDVLGSGDCH